MLVLAQKIAVHVAMASVPAQKIAGIARMIAALARFVVTVCATAAMTRATARRTVAAQATRHGMAAAAKATVWPGMILDVLIPAVCGMAVTASAGALA